MICNQLLPHSLSISQGSMATLVTSCSCFFVSSKIKRKNLFGFNLS